ncbi:hypothetical protein TH63_11935 [Rufibacter radiotolerans]|uniref:Beta-lactamase-related domain-containing protein n=1 Tax=Rufibacter radiotolerans TaxID=1379910 RepID=A0A0H4W6X3_9BACT|nr:serine hydrolase domain-containing protein [Rufibacter radiotolerans]AKQ46176.1 hypothetical protein TH63_11935 [Rufibacter radiotolerans]
MKIFLYLVFSLFLTSLAKAQPAYDFKQVDRLLEQKLPQLKGQGGGYALVMVKDGKMIYDKSFGQFTADRPVPIASATKWLSGAVIMSLVDAGQLKLEDKVADYLPGFTGEKANITIRQLFSHTSGLPGEGLDSPVLNQRQVPFDTLVAQIAAMKLVAKPGTELHYGGLSMQVAGRIAEKVSGMAWEELFQQKIGQPLGMRRTTFGRTSPLRNPRIAGGAVSTANDYMKFLQMLLNKGHYQGKRVLSEKAVQTLLQDQTRQAKVVESPFTKFMPLLKDKTEVRYGIGVWRERVHPKTGQVLEAVSPGAFGFTPWIDVENNLAGVFSTRSAFVKVMPVYLQVKGLVKEELAAKPGN